jgi:N-acetylglucosamine-6-phosphate deacetylase
VTLLNTRPFGYQRNIFLLSPLFILAVLAASNRPFLSSRSSILTGHLHLAAVVPILLQQTASKMTSPSVPRITKFTNGLLLRNSELVGEDLWVDSHTGKILDRQSAFYGEHLVPDQIINLNGRILSPGFIDVQLNGAHGLDFSVPSETYASDLKDTNRKLVTSGVTSYLPTVTSQKPEVYHSVLPHLGPSDQTRQPYDGAESLGAHVEGPFLSPAKNGIHNPDVLLQAHSFADVINCYGAENFPNITMMTAAPELGNMTSLIPTITSKDIIFSIGHSDGTLEDAQSALAAGATMVTHMFNAMRPFGHRDPGIFGLLGQSESASTSRPSSPKTSKPSSPKPSSPRSSAVSTPRSRLSICSNASELADAPLAKPYFGLIADGIHLHGSSVSIAYNAHPSGTILVTDAMYFAGCPDGTYEWTNGERIIKDGPVLRLEANGRIAGSAVTLIECVNNFKKFTGSGWGETLKCVTGTPAKMLGKKIDGRKGGLDGGMDADLVVLEETIGEYGEELSVREVWKFGVCVHES